MPDPVDSLRRGYVSLFISNLLPETSKAELLSMFWSTRRIMDTFILVDGKTGKKRGIGFARFRTKEEALRAMSRRKAVHGEVGNFLLLSPDPQLQSFARVSTLMLGLLLGYGYLCGPWSLRMFEKSPAGS